MIEGAYQQYSARWDRTKMSAEDIADLCLKPLLSFTKDDLKEIKWLQISKLSHDELKKLGLESLINKPKEEVENLGFTY
jgi:hypothetical protein